jgi:hypothetical protein
LRIKIVILLTSVLILAESRLFAQNLHTASTKAMNYYNSGKEQYDFLRYADAEKDLRQAIVIDKNFYEAYMVLAELLSKSGRFDESASSYREAVRIDSLFYRPVFFPLATAELKAGDYHRASIHFKVYLEQKNVSDKNRAAASKGLKDCEFAIREIARPVPFNPVNTGDSVNTTDDEYWPSITADGKTLMFTRQEVARGGIKGQEDFYISHLRTNGWSKALNPGAPLNTSSNEGAQSLSSDGTYMYYTACSRPGGLGSCDIYYSKFDGQYWSAGLNLGPPVNTSAWEAQPSVSANGRMIFFASNRQGGRGGMDIWYSVAGADGKWKTPKNAGDVINTAGDEMSPFIHFDGRTLYFSSNGRTGMGGFDIYFSRMKEDTTWTEPVNLGYPINTSADEMGLIIDASGQQGFYSTIRDKTNGKDIFYFNLYDSIKPDPVSYFRGTVYDRLTMQKLKAVYELTNLKSGEVVSSGNTDSNGSFLVCLPSGFNYGLNVNRDGYLFYSDNFMFEGTHTATSPFIKNILLNAIRVGETMQLSNVFYEFDSWELKKESVAELDRLFNLLKDNPTIKVEVAGYTDSIGSVKYNQSLSEKRAKSVVTFIQTKGIPAERLSYKGYGSATPIGNNITNEGRKLNRRVEVRITGKK